jgi:hypothetical protein
MSDIFIKDLQVAYADVVENIFNCWTHDDDGGCDYDAVGRKQVYTINNVMIIYQPIAPGDGWVDDGCVLIGPTKESGMTLTNAVWKKAKPLFREVEKKMIDSFNSFVTKYQGWMEITNDEPLSFNQLLSIKSPIDFDEKSKKLKMKWELKTYCHIISRWWNPVELMNWKYTLPRFEVNRQKIMNDFKKQFEEAIQKTTLDIQELKQKLKVSDGTDSINLNEKLSNAEENLVYQNTEFEKLKIRASNLKEPQEQYIDCDEDYIKEWFGTEHYDYKRTKHITYEEAFGVEEGNISGKKRKFEGESSCVKKMKI